MPSSALALRTVSRPIRASSSTAAKSPQRIFARWLRRRRSSGRGSVAVTGLKVFRIERFGDRGGGAGGFAAGVGEDHHHRTGGGGPPPPPLAPAPIMRATCRGVTRRGPCPIATEIVSPAYHGCPRTC